MTPENIPRFVKLSDGVCRKIYFKGKSYVCTKSNTKHTYLEGSAGQLSQENLEETNNTTQEKTANKQQQMTSKQQQTEDAPTANKQQKLNSTISGRNRTTTENATKQTTKTNKPSTNKGGLPSQSMRVNDSYP